MNPKPRARSRPSVSRMRPGATWTIAFSRWNVVPTTASSPWAARTSWAISSSSVASGTKAHHPAAGDVVGMARGVQVELGLEELLGALAAIPGAPPEVGLLQDHRAQLEDAVHQRLRARRAARDVQVDGQELVGRHDRVVV